jgi:hypothetical protein
MKQIIPLIQTVEKEKYYFHSIAAFESVLEGITVADTKNTEFTFAPFHAKILAVQHVTSEDALGRFDVVDLVFGTSAHAAPMAYSIPAGAPNLGRYRTLFPHVQVDKGFNIGRLYDHNTRFNVAGIQNIDDADTVNARYAVIAGLYTNTPTKVVKALASKRMATQILEKKITIGASTEAFFDFTLDRSFNYVGINQFRIEGLADSANLQAKKKTYVTLDVPPAGLRDFPFKNYGEFQVLAERKMVFPLPIVGYGQRIPLKVKNEEASEVSFNVTMEITCWED